MSTTSVRRFLGCLAGLLGAAATLMAQGSLALVSAEPGGKFGNGHSFWSATSRNGRFVAFMSHARNLTPDDVNPTADIFVKDMQTGNVRLVSASATGEQANRESMQPSISADGRYVAFLSGATNLVATPSPNFRDCFVKDLATGAIQRVSSSSAGVPAGDWTMHQSISANGRYVAFISAANNLVPGDTPGTWDVFRKDLVTGQTVLVSRWAAPDPNTQYTGLSLSADGRYVSFDATSYAYGFPGDQGDVYVRDVQTEFTTRVTTPDGSLPNGLCKGGKLSADGRYIAFESAATNFGILDQNYRRDVYVKDLVAGTVRVASAAADGSMTVGDSWEPSISDDGRLVAFISVAPNLADGLYNNLQNIFLKDMETGSVRRISLAYNGLLSEGPNYTPSISGDGAYVSFVGFGYNLLPGDNNGVADVFRREVSEPVGGGVALYLYPNSVPWGAYAVGTVALTSPAGPSGAVVSLSSTSAAIDLPATVTVDPGSRVATFKAQTRYTSVRFTSRLTAGFGTSTSSATLAVTPDAPPIYPGSIVTRDSKYRPVVGVVCDNTAYTPAAQRDLVRFHLTGQYYNADIAGTVVSSTGVPVSNMGSVEVNNNRLEYFPPLEFNPNQSPTSLDGLLQDATRDTYVRVLSRSYTGDWHVVPAHKLVIGRVPMVLVHGANSDPSAWTAFHNRAFLGYNSRLKNYAAPMFAIDHSNTPVGNGYGGRGRLENAASQLARGIRLVLDEVVAGRPIPGGPWPEFAGFSAQGPMAIRRVDVVAHSYGGLVARWYLANRPADTEGWYFNLPADAGPAEAPPAYRGDVRKLVTLGTPWRGLPIANVFNEVSASPSLGIADFGLAPVLGTPGLGAWLQTQPLVGDVRYPAWQAMGVDSPWLRWLNHRTLNIFPGVRTSPFLDTVAYASVVGDAPGSEDLHAALRALQTPSWFPYSTLEIRQGSAAGYSDGVVPVWSATIPGSSVTLGLHHANLLYPAEPFERVLPMLASKDMPGGAELNGLWSTTPVTPREGPAWTFEPGKMAPFPQSLVYANVPMPLLGHTAGVARLAQRKSDAVQGSVRELDQIRLYPGGQKRWAVILKLYSTLAPSEVNVRVTRVADGVHQDFALGAMAAGWKNLKCAGTFAPGSYVAQAFWRWTDADGHKSAALETAPIAFDIE